MLDAVIKGLLLQMQWSRGATAVGTP